ncbi:glycoside hydrolase 5 family protein [Hyphomicrobium sp.]|uniref:glycoside hydrolase 5 family protein n=1 Tax=Hyphomicrobium sp. TaxID=82 RepID=UPI002D777820|nr:cellulase family glycosylhydrolase [Hyphomicrobium sp.]HET6391062.1 cellulase family glycosylhydrolase [Hyphomicrobium sp.]
MLKGEPLFVAGVNNHYLPFGSPAEVTRVLDDAVAMNANVVRTFIQPVIGSLDGTTPTIWNWRSTADSSNLNVHGVVMMAWDPIRARMVVNDGPDGLQRIDFLLDEARKRGLKVILAFLDFWSYTGGAQQMRAWYGSDDEYSFFAKDPRTIADYKRWVKTVITRVNSINGVSYAADPTIFSWELMNEPDIHPAPLLATWLNEMAVYVKSLDRNHLLASGHSNPTGEFPDMAISKIDFGTWHGYPRFNGITPEQMTDRISAFCSMSVAFNKPVLLEEFGWSKAHANQLDVYGSWMQALYNSDCAGWVVWRLVSRQDSGLFPADPVDGFDIHNDGGQLWTLMQSAAKKQIDKQAKVEALSAP